jgi:hypothetical protein
MDATTTAARVRYGYGKAANVLGRTTTIYRPNGTGAAIVAGNIFGSRLAAFDTAPTFTFVNPQKIDNATFYALMDATGLHAADYLLSVAGTFFVASVGDIAPPMVIQCSHVYAITRGAQTITAGFQPYSGVNEVNETTLYAAVPMFSKIDRTGREPRAKIAADAMGEPSHVIYGPPVYLAGLLERDILTDETGQRFQIVALEYEPLATVIRAQHLVA